MTAARFRALRFVLPASEPATGPSSGPAAEGSGLQHSPRGGLSTVVGDDSIRQALLLLISTRPGERVNRPAYGCNLQKLVFAPADDTTAGLAMHYVQQAVRQWEPRVDVVTLDAIPTDDLTGDPVIEIHLTYRVRSTASVDTLVVTMPLTAGSVL